ncbi:hypothetical protein IMSHALPRED_007410 [Imshaugia aleurites]|uniref:BTB domain-containing protein n=1 Tax=Imshaugia aleurites TaxID=172621 RepID=A0A8H3IHH8_9LECA|nr:hypothetical protein IMSHALPRED_007410 [Imshaugia aleurites]
MVDVFVGTEPKKFHLHRDLLCDRSEYFEACFGSEFEEAREKELHLPEDNVAGFELFVEWLYGSTLRSIENEDALISHIALHVLASKFCLEHLQNEAMDLIIRFYRVNPRLVEAQSLIYIYENTSEGDFLRRFSVRLVAWNIVETGVTDLSPSYNTLLGLGGELAVDLTSWLIKISANLRAMHGFDDDERDYLKDPRSVSNCTFHKHNSTIACRSMTE